MWPHFRDLRLTNVATFQKQNWKTKRFVDAHFFYTSTVRNLKRRTLLRLSLHYFFVLLAEKRLGPKTTIRIGISVLRFLLLCIDTCLTKKLCVSVRVGKISEQE